MNSEREAHKAAFLAEAGLAGARREALPGDASTRHYERLIRDGKPTLMLMDAPQAAESEALGADASPSDRMSAGYNAMARVAGSRMEAFVAAAAFLRSRGLSAPLVEAYDADLGFAVMEDLGEGLFAALMQDGQAEEPLYLTAIEALARLHEETPPAMLQGDGASWPLLTYDNLALRTGADLFIQWFPKLSPSVVIDDEGVADWDGMWRPLRMRAERGARVFTHRDYHAENLVWLPKREGVARIGMLDFQDCVLSHPSWDLHSLLQDARRDVSSEIETAALNHYFVLRPDIDPPAFMEDYTALAALNQARIIGIFARLITRDGKPKYAAFLPRLWRHLEANLRHPDLEEARRWFNYYVPKEARQ